MYASGHYAFAVEGLKEAHPGLTDEDIVRAAVRATNDALDFGRTRAAEEMRKQVRFPARYLQGNETGRLQVTQRAQAARLEGHITGRDNPTSLARFVSGSQAGKGGIRVSVKPGRSSLIKNAFLMKLRAGNDGPLSNIGLAVRTKGGPPKAFKPKKLSDKLWLLYGPSVNQVFRTVRDDISGPVEERWENEFHRLLGL